MVEQHVLDYNNIIVSGDLNTTESTIDRSSKTIENCGPFFLK